MVNLLELLGMGAILWGVWLMLLPLRALVLMVWDRIKCKRGHS